MLEINPQYFEDEVREGFFIPSCIKRAWACQLSLLYELDQICTENNLHYSLEYGSLLGAIRHGGFIPWDDDLDIVMRREDLVALMKICSDKENSKFHFINFETNDYHWKFTVGITYNDRMCFEPEYLKTHYNFPYMGSLDVWIADRVSDNDEEESQRNKAILELLAMDSAFDEDMGNESERRAYAEQLKRKYGIDLSSKNTVEIRREIHRKILSYIEKFDEENTSLYSQVVPFGIKKERRYPEEYYTQNMRVQFECIEVNVPARADELLSVEYGNYLKPFRGTWGHGYPYFETQRKQLNSKEDYYLRFHFQKEMLTTEYNTSNSLKEIAREYIEHLKYVWKELLKYKHEEMLEDVYVEELSVLDFLCSEQQMAIDFGTLVESVKGEETNTVRNLEGYCEGIYQTVELGEGITAVINCYEQLIDVIQKEIIERKEIVFLPYKAEYWESWAKVYEEVAELSKEEYDIYVIPLPYGYKEYDGSLLDLQCKMDGYPNGVKLISYETYDFSIHCPEIVYIQNPYDQYNLATGTIPELYISNIRPFVKEMIYIPYLIMDDFEQEDENMKYNMKHFCFMPGVVYANHIYLPSENQRERYMEMLSEWAGEDTASVWSERIKVKDCQSSRQNLERKNTKILLYYCSAGRLLCERESYIAKIKSNVEIIGKKEGIEVIIKTDDYFIDNLKQQDEDLLLKWYEILEMIKKYPNISLDYETKVKELSELADAYYGEPSVYSSNMLRLKKPVMIGSI